MRIFAPYKRTTIQIYKKLNNMRMNDERINVRGSINSLRVKGKLELPKAGLKPSYVRNAASSVASDTGKKFSVSVVGETIVVTRKS